MRHSLRSRTRRPVADRRVAAVLFAAAPSLAGGALAALPEMYVLDYLSASGSSAVAINGDGVALGVRNVDMKCGFDCAPTLVEGVWVGSEFRELPWLPGWERIELEGISDDGWVVGTAYDQVDIRAIVWKPVGDGYEILEIPNLPDTDYTTALGIDDDNRVVGFANRIFPLVDRPFVWTEVDGVVDLTELGFPDAHPEAISPGGTVAYTDGWYRLDDPGVVHLNTPPPEGFRGPGAYFEVNDAGDQLRMIVRTDGQPIHYPFRYTNDGTWQQIWPAGGSDASPFNPGSITADLDIAMTVGASAIVAPGLAGGGELLTDRLSPAYGDASAGEARRMNEQGQILGEVTIGRSSRLVRFVEAQPCTTDCIQVSAMEMRAEFVDDPGDPGRCVGVAHVRTGVRMRVTDELGNPLAGVQVSGVFMDDEWLEAFRRGTTDSRGVLRLAYSGTPCTGAIAFLVVDAEKDGRTFDRVSGTLQTWMLPE